MSGTVLFNSLASPITGAVSVDVIDPWAASFSTGAVAVTLSDVKLGLFFDVSLGGQASGKLVVSLDSDSSTAPGTVITTLGTITHSSLPTSAAGTLDLSAFAPVSLTAHTRYWIDLTDSDIGVQWTATSATTGTGVAGEFIDNSNKATSDSAGPLVMEVSAACYVQGTRILTSRGEVRVEELKIGDVLPTANGAGPQPIIWIGHRTIDITRHPDPEKIRPVRVRAGAFSDGQPAEDLRLSPDHAVYLWEKLIPIRCLINGTTVTQEQADSITYFHIELPRHAIILAEQLPAESFLDLGNRAAFENAGETITLHPDFHARIWREKACAELILGGPVLIAAQTRLKLQARWIEHARSKAFFFEKKNQKTLGLA